MPPTNIPHLLIGVVGHDAAGDAGDAGLLATASGTGGGGVADNVAVSSEVGSGGGAFTGGGNNAGAKTGNGKRTVLLVVVIGATMVADIFLNGRSGPPAQSAVPG
jgi:hypothetical protein